MYTLDSPSVITEDRSGSRAKHFRHQVNRIIDTLPGGLRSWHRVWLYGLKTRRQVQVGPLHHPFTMIGHLIAATAFFVASAIAVPLCRYVLGEAIDILNAAWPKAFAKFFNSRGQSVCLVGAYLGAQCTTDNSVSHVHSQFKLATDRGISPQPSKLKHSLVMVLESCNSVMWNLMSACALCQGKAFGSWGQWMASCPPSMITVGKYPIPLPKGVTVPSWAYYDFTNSGNFDPAMGPESSAIAAPTSTGPNSTATDVNPNPTMTQSQSSSNTGAIVGGVIGGVLGIVLICLIAFVLVRKRKQQEPTINNPRPSQNQQMAAQPNLATPIAGHAAPYQPSTPNSEYKPYYPSPKELRVNHHILISLKFKNSWNELETTDTPVVATLGQFANKYIADSVSIPPMASKLILLPDAATIAQTFLCFD
ncbi:glycophorin A domain-containing protein [Rhizoctonia solani AG-1 IA]|uniref:Glycophorin A domain-containing protein n=1 Tax=Thanatephorus cucumeris (strain AG1-IA) TaxID=983506 RepID=L8WSG3_THACA|nr:glycophorin A domain-containing protein [Rhizoctonia solani AG-1 IA]